MKRDSFAPDSFLKVFSGLELEFAPGARFSYSNSNYFVLGVLIERVTGQPYAAGMLYSTVRDLHRWKRALHRGAPFRDAGTLARMLTPPVTDDTATRTASA